MSVRIVGLFVVGQLIGLAKQAGAFVHAGLRLL
jgi:hypothetical protein